MKRIVSYVTVGSYVLLAFTSFFFFSQCDSRADKSSAMSRASSVRTVLTNVCIAQISDDKYARRECVSGPVYRRFATHV